MYKLTVIGGANRGTSYPLQEGRTTLGRQVGNEVVLSSGKVSKKHCVLVVEDGQVRIEDLGSSNGTFVNGQLIKSKILQPGDKVSVGDFILEFKLAALRSADQAPAVILGSAATSLPSLNPSSPSGDLGAPSQVAMDLMPSDLKGKIIWYFEKFVMPFFYGLNLKQEWRTLGILCFSFILIGNLALSIYPMMESSYQTIVQETGKRAQYIAQEIANKNSSLLAARQETRTEIGSAEEADGVRVAVLTDMSNRIIAPGSRQNQYLADGVEAQLAVLAAKAFQKGREQGITRSFRSAKTVVSIEPVKVFDTALGRNKVIAQAVVSIDTSLATPDMGTIGVTYSNTFIITALFGGILVFVLYRLSLKPLEVLNEDIDKVLKGEMNQVTHEFKCEELNSLYEVINSALQRLPKGNEGGDLGGAQASQIEDLAPAVDLFGSVRVGAILLDDQRNIVKMNQAFEDLSGIRADTVVGQDIPSVARDQAFGSLATDMFDQALPGSTVEESFDFSGVPFVMKCISLNGKGYLLTAQRSEEAEAA